MKKPAIHSFFQQVLFRHVTVATFSLIGLISSVSNAEAGTVIPLQNGVSPSSAYSAPGFTLRGDAHNADPLLFAGRSGAGEPLRAVIQFDLAPIGAGKINNVRLRLRPSNTAQPGDATDSERVVVYLLPSGFSAETVSARERAPGVPWTAEEKTLALPELGFLTVTPSLAAAPGYLNFPATPELLRALEKARDAKQRLAVLIAAQKAETFTARWVAGFFAPHSGETVEEQRNRRPILEVTLE
jgi:hypothetical protein